MRSRRVRPSVFSIKPRKLILITPRSIGVQLLLNGLVLELDADKHAAAAKRLVELNESIKTIVFHLDDAPSQNHGPEYLAQLVDANNLYNEFKTSLLGGTVHASIVELVNPSPSELRDYSANFFDSGFRKQILSVGANTLAFGFTDSCRNRCNARRHVFLLD